MLNIHILHLIGLQYLPLGDKSLKYPFNDEPKGQNSVLILIIPIEMLI